MTLPQQARLSLERIEAWLQSIAGLSAPAAWEIVGADRSVSFRLAARTADASLLQRTLEAYVPDAVVTPASKSLMDVWRATDGSLYAVREFGLLREFMVPLRSFSSLDPDPVTSLVAQLASIPPGMLGFMQILFAPCAFDWNRETRKAVTTPSGTPFFADAPEITSLAAAKLASPLAAVVVRVGAKGRDEDDLWEVLWRLASGLSQFAAPDRNALAPLASEDYGVLEEDVLFRQSHRPGMLLSLQELAALVHPPSPTLALPEISRSIARGKQAPKVLAQTDDLVLGENPYRGSSQKVSLNRGMRSKHMHILGATGTGKSTLLVQLALQDTRRGEGFALIDPHGDLVDDVLSRLPEDRIDDVVLLDPVDPDFVVGWNVLQARTDAERDMLASDLTGVFRRLATSWGDQMTTVLANAVLAFLTSSRGGTLLNLRHFLSDTRWREEFLDSVEDEFVVEYFRNEFPFLKGRPTLPILTRLNSFLRPRHIRDVVAKSRRPLDFRGLVEEKKILLVKLAQGALGTDNAALLGSLIVSKLHQVMLTRQDLARDRRTPFYLYVDEFHECATPSMAALFSGVRKYGLGLVVAHQDLYQLRAKVPDVERSVLANAHTRICFRVADQDARVLERGFSFFTADDLENLEIGEAICRVGRRSDDFNLHTWKLRSVSPVEAERKRARIRKRSGTLYGSRRSSVTVTATPPPSGEEEERDKTASLEKSTHRQRSTPPPREDPKSAPAASRKRDLQPDEVTSKPPGRGGAEHIYLQELIKQLGEAQGFSAVVEEAILDGAGIVDVGLHRDDRSIAVEIAITSGVKTELANIIQAFEAGFTHVLVVSSRKKFLRLLRAAVDTDVPERHRKEVSCLTPEMSFSYLSSLDRVASKERVGGYAVEVSFAEGDATESSQRDRAITDILLKSLQSLKGDAS
ncbi:MAG: type IV secretion system DNA-binding domain-containing protein [Acidobacteriota bacterium]